jgi:hypothetical protein
MQAAAAIHDAARRFDEAAAIFRLKSRNVQEECGELGAQWIDSRARQFTRKHIEPQRDLIEQGARLCQAHAELVDSARAAAQESEQEISGFFAAHAGHESASESARHTTNVARDQANRSAQDSSRVSAELRSISAAIAAAAMDPGW